MLHLGIVRPDERGLITNPLGLAAVRLTLVDEPKEGLVAGRCDHREDAFQLVLGEVFG